MGFAKFFETTPITRGCILVTCPKTLFRLDHPFDSNSTALNANGLIQQSQNLCPGEGSCWVRKDDVLFGRGYPGEKHIGGGFTDNKKLQNRWKLTWFCMIMNVLANGRCSLAGPIWSKWPLISGSWEWKSRHHTMILVDIKQWSGSPQTPAGRIVKCVSESCKSHRWSVSQGFGRRSLRVRQWWCMDCLERDDGRSQEKRMAVRWFSAVQIKLLTLLFDAVCSREN